MRVARSRALTQYIHGGLPNEVDVEMRVARLRA